MHRKICVTMLVLLRRICAIWINTMPVKLQQVFDTAICSSMECMISGVMRKRYFSRTTTDYQEAQGYNETIQWGSPWRPHCSYQPQRNEMDMNFAFKNCKKYGSPYIVAITICTNMAGTTIQVCKCNDRCILDWQGSAKFWLLVWLLYLV